MAPPGMQKGHYRLQKELADIQKQTGDSQVNAQMKGDNIMSWIGHIHGPSGTPYEGGHFTLDIDIPPEYPYSPPKIHFVTKVLHPNVSSQTGAICLDVLKSEWSPAMTIRTALLSIQALLSAPEPDDPQDALVATMYKKNRADFNRTARMWTKTFAKKTMDSQDEKIKKITEMGFTEEEAKQSLSSHAWDETMALNSLLGNS